MSKQPIQKAALQLRDRGHVVAASFLAKWPFGVNLVVSCVVFVIKTYPSAMMAWLQSCYVLIAVVYWLMEARFLRRHWKRGF